MATTVTPAALTVTLTTSITLDGENITFNVNDTISSVSEYRKVLVDVPTSEIQLLGVDPAGVGGVGALADSKLIIVQNMDDTNFCRIRFNENAGDTFDKKLQAGEFFMFYNKEFEVNTTEAAFGAFVNVEEIKAQFDTAGSQVKIIMFF